MADRADDTELALDRAHRTCVHRRADGTATTCGDPCTILGASPPKLLCAALAFLRTASNSDALKPTTGPEPFHRMRCERSRSGAARANRRKSCGLFVPVRRSAIPHARTPYGVILLTRHASRCRAGQSAPRLPSRAPGVSGTLCMGLGKPDTKSRRVPCSARTHAWIFRALRVTHSCYTPNSTVTGCGPFPRVRRFSQGARARAER